MFFNLGVAPKEPISYYHCCWCSILSYIESSEQAGTLYMWELFPNLAAPYEIFGEEETQIKLQ